MWGKIFNYSIILLIFFSLILSGCEFDFTPRDPCIGDEDSRHCYQNLAVERKDPKLCEKIEAPEGFTKSNPPKDKCYMMVAQGTGDATICNNMVGGEGSYERKDCIVDVATEQIDFKACDMLSGDSRKECYESIGKNLKTNDLLNTLDRIEQIENDLIYSWRDKEKTAELKKELAELKKKQDLMYVNADPSVQRDYYRSQREKIFDTIEDDEIKKMVSRDFRDYRSKHGDASVTELFERMKEIREEKETIQKIDQEANKLIDDLKNNIIDYGSGKAQEGVDKIAGAAWEWSFSKGSEEMKYRMSKLEEMKNKYDKASAQYKAITEQIDKFKKVYDEVSEVYTKVNKFNSMVANGDIEEGHAEVLKGAVYLGKGLEYATGYVPVFGSTISTISKETFEMTVKLATERAKRSKSLNDCFTDPENCDPDGITAY
jgi:prefoldin subunit 5